MTAKSEPIQPYRETLKKQIAFLAEAQKDACEGGSFATVLCYTDKILSLSKELEGLSKEPINISVSIDDTKIDELSDRTIIENPVKEMLENFQTSDLILELKERNALRLIQVEEYEYSITGRFSGRI